MKKFVTCHHKISRKSPLRKNELLCAPDSEAIFFLNSVKIISVS